MNTSFCTDDFAVQPYWWDETPRPQIVDQVLPSHTDVLVVGSGYTGLQCALQTAQAGRHTWMGFVAYTFDELPHLGQKDGIHYAMGYCGSGICLASYLGNRLGLQLLGKEEGASAFDKPRFQTRPFYSGKPWFLAPSVRYYQLLDRFS